jgi:hypothetical protein
MRGKWFGKDELKAARTWAREKSAKVFSVTIKDKGKMLYASDVLSQSIAKEMAAGKLKVKELKV